MGRSRRFLIPCLCPPSPHENAQSHFIGNAIPAEPHESGSEKEADSIIVPFGGGGLFTGIASAVKARKKSVKMFASEVETAAPLSASLAANRPMEIKRIPSFVDGIGGGNVAQDMWERVRPLVSDSLVVTLREVAIAIKILSERNRVVAEGAGASSLAAALKKADGEGLGKTVCVISGGNLDSRKLIQALQGKVPGA